MVEKQQEYNSTSLSRIFKNNSNTKDCIKLQQFSMQQIIKKIKDTEKKIQDYPLPILDCTGAALLKEKHYFCIQNIILS